MNVSLQIGKPKHNFNSFIWELSFFYFKQNLHVLQEKVLYALMANEQKINKGRQQLFKCSKLTGSWFIKLVLLFVFQGGVMEKREKKQDLNFQLQTEAMESWS